MNALARLGMVSETPSENQTMTTVSVEPAKDYFVERDGVKFAGMHLLIDLWGATNLDSPELIDKTLCAGALEAGATILHSHFHHFTPNGGVSRRGRAGGKPYLHPHLAGTQFRGTGRLHVRRLRPVQSHPVPESRLRRRHPSRSTNNAAA